MTSIHGDDPLAVLSRVFGYSSFRGEQEAIVRHVIAGGDAVVLMPTGGGKSICYQIPALCREGTGVVLSPLVALMHDQVEALRLAGVSAAALNSSMPQEEQAVVERAFLAGELDLLYLAPERLGLQTSAGEGSIEHSRTVRMLQRGQVALFAIDEAHCVSQWGHDFRPDYLGLGELADLWPGVPRMALTATATPATQRELREKLRLDRAAHYVSSFDRPNIRYRIEAKTKVREQLVDYVREHAGEAGIVYALSRKRVEQAAGWLVDAGIDAIAYHAGLPSEHRRAAQTRFLREDGVVIVATIAFGMGIDKPDVRFVAHIDLPKSVEGYYQETGRAGRDGAPAEAWMAYGLADVVQQRQLIEAGSPVAQRENEMVRRNQIARLGHMLELCETTECRRTYLLRHFGEETTRPCGNCDVCIDPPQLWDATIPAQKLLSTVLRTAKERDRTFAAGQHIDVLRGVMSDRVRSVRLDQLSTWGIGSDLTAAAWRGIVRHLLASGALETRGEWGVLVPGEAAKPILRGEAKVFVREEVVKRGSRSSAGVKRTAHSAELSPSQLETFERLRAWRLAEAREQGVPPYVVFSDATLSALAAGMPSSDAELLGIPGIGQAKLARYGAAIREELHGQS